jgi:hypothetical protein
MKINIINEDQAISIDGEAIVADLLLDDNIWVIHWDSVVEEGTIEYKDNTPNEAITDFSDYEYLITLHATVKADNIASDAAAQEAEANLPVSIRNKALGDIAWTRPSDGVVVQVRHPDFASDYFMMKEAHDNMENEGTEAWIDIDNNAILMTKPDFFDALAYNRAQTKTIFAVYIPTL